MKNLSIRKQYMSKVVVPSRQYSYHELVEYLDTRWSPDLKDASLSCIKKLDKEFGSPSQMVNAILITGTNGKSLTTHFAARLLQKEGLKVGAFFSPHLLTYNERFVCNNELISNKIFTDLGNEILPAAFSLGLQPHALDILTTMALRYFVSQQVDVAILELTDLYGADPLLICNPIISAVTRITDLPVSQDIESTITRVLSVVSPATRVVCADQSKINLQIMEKITIQKKGIWAMPIRKLAPLSYPFEQLHGRGAALAERVAQLFMSAFLKNDTVVLSNSLLVKQKGQRGRPSLESRRLLGMQPRQTIEQFWKENSNALPGRFQFLDKEKPAVLLDIASNVDAMENLLLGIRLLNYQHPIKGLVLILATANKQIQEATFLKQLRYFFKKMSGSVIMCPVQYQVSLSDSIFLNHEKMTNDLKSMKIKARCAKNFAEALETAIKSVDERHGLIVVAGSPALITEYWNNKGTKKL